MTDSELLCQKFAEEAKPTPEHDRIWMNGYRAGQESMEPDLYENERVIGHLQMGMEVATKMVEGLQHNLVTLESSIRLLHANLKVMLAERGVDLDELLLEIKRRHDTQH